MVININKEQNLLQISKKFLFCMFCLINKNNKMKKNSQNQILKILSRKKAVPIDKIKKESGDNLTTCLNEPSSKYAINRSIKNIIDSGLAEVIPSEQNEYLRLTPLGKQKFLREELSNNSSAIINSSWDGFWRIILLDLPEERKNERDSLRYLLKKAGFLCLKNSAWVSPYPFEHFFINIKKDLNLETELIIIITQFIDEATQKVLLKKFSI